MARSFDPQNDAPQAGVQYTFTGPVYFNAPGRDGQRRPEGVSADPSTSSRLPASLPPKPAPPPAAFGARTDSSYDNVRGGGPPHAMFDHFPRPAQPAFVNSGVHDFWGGPYTVPGFPLPSLPSRMSAAYGFGPGSSWQPFGFQSTMDPMQNPYDTNEHPTMATTRFQSTPRMHTVPHVPTSTTQRTKMKKKDRIWHTSIGRPSGTPSMDNVDSEAAEASEQPEAAEAPKESRTASHPASVNDDVDSHIAPVQSGINSHVMTSSSGAECTPQTPTHHQKANTLLSMPSGESTAAKLAEFSIQTLAPTLCEPTMRQVLGDGALPGSDAGSLVEGSGPPQDIVDPDSLGVVFSYLPATTVVNWDITLENFKRWYNVQRSRRATTLGPNPGSSFIPGYIDCFQPNEKWPAGLLQVYASFLDRPGNTAITVGGIESGTWKAVDDRTDHLLSIWFLESQKHWVFLDCRPAAKTLRLFDSLPRFVKAVAKNICREYKTAMLLWYKQHGLKVPDLDSFTQQVVVSSFLPLQQFRAKLYSIAIHRETQSVVALELYASFDSNWCPVTGT